MDRRPNEQIVGSEIQRETDTASRITARPRLTTKKVSRVVSLTIYEGSSGNASAPRSKAVKTAAGRSKESTLSEEA